MKFEFRDFFIFVYIQDRSVALLSWIKIYSAERPDIFRMSVEVAYWGVYFSCDATNSSSSQPRSPFFRIVPSLLTTMV